MPRTISAKINPEMLRWARARVGMPLSVAAKKISVDESLVAEWELGNEKPSFAQLRTIANVFRRPLAFFYLSEAPEDFPIPHDFRRIQSQTSVSFELVQALRTAHFRREAILRIHDGYGQPRKPFDLKIDSDQPPDQIASEVRRVLGVSLASQKATRDPFSSLRLWKDAVEVQGVLVFQASRISVQEMRGFSIANDLAPVVVVNSKDAPTARVFSLLHEFAHLLLHRHKGSICVFSESESTDSEERLCDAIAANVLVPSTALLQQPEVKKQRNRSTWDKESISALARRFGVSEFVIIRRLLTLRKISKARFQQHANEIRDRVYSSPGKGGPTYYRTKVAQLGRPYIRTVLGAYDDNVITARDAVEYLDVRIDNFNKLAEAV
ncbi:MAG: ImmA/IrrE family metallo-endopeptidase [Nannocystaceae bacterium]